MNEETIAEIADELRREHDAVLADRDEQHWAALRRALDLLPDVAEWVIAAATPAVLAISPRGILFTVRADEDRGVSVESRPLAADKLIVRMALGPAIPIEGQTTMRRASWSFSYVGEAEDAPRDKWQDIRGRVDTDQRGQQRLDRRERFARRIARAGWGLEGRATDV
jgi:hypothetical protein